MSDIAKKWPKLVAGMVGIAGMFRSYRAAADGQWQRRHRAARLGQGSYRLRRSVSIPRAPCPATNSATTRPG